MAEAVEDHRASSERPEPRSIYGKIVSSADRSYSVNEILARAYDYNKTLHPDYTEDELIEAVRSPDGYAATKIYFLKEEYYEFLKEVDRLTRDPEQFKKAQQEFNKKRGL